MSVSEILSQNLQAISTEIRSACVRVGRDPASVRLVAVTKYAEWPCVLELSHLHQTFGENRPHQLAERQRLLSNVEWHLIGQLQRNKVRTAVMHSAMIHSVDSLRLLERIADMATDPDMNLRLLLQVNVSEETSKSGFTTEDLWSQWPNILKFTERVRIDGLMTMAAESDNPEDARPVFRSLRELRDRLVSREDARAARVTLPELSMGMSGDFVPAIEEGATLIRIGSRIFAGLN